MLVSTILLFAVGHSFNKNHILKNIDQSKEKLSAKCIYQNIQLANRQKVRVLILRQNQSTAEDFLIKRIYKSQWATIQIADQLQIASTAKVEYMAPIQIVWFINKFTDYDDIEKMFRLFQFATKIHFIFCQKVFTLENELERITRAYFGLIDENYLSRVRFHVVKSVGIDETYLWRVYKRSRESRRAIDKLSECRYSSKTMKLVQFRKKSSCNPCALRILARKHEPYTHFNDENWFYNGMEIQLMQTIAKRLGMRATYALDTSVVGVAYIGQIDNGQIDLIIGGFGNISNEQSAFVSSRPYFQDGATWCVAHARPLPPWVNLFLVFDDVRIVVLNLVIFFLGAVLTFCFTLKRYIGRDMCFPETCMIFFQICLCSPSKQRVRTTLARAMAAILLFMIFFHYQAMTSCYISIIAFDIEGFQMKTRLELARANLDLTGDLDSYRWLAMDYKVRHRELGSGHMSSQ